MAQEIIRKIQEAEAQAQKVRADATAEAKRRVATAEADGKALCEWVEANCNTENKDKLAQIQDKAEQMLAHHADQAQQNARLLTEDAELRMRDAVRLILGGVMEQCQ